MDISLRCSNLFPFFTQIHPTAKRNIAIGVTLIATAALAIGLIATSSAAVAFVSSPLGLAGIALIVTVALAALAIRHYHNSSRNALRTTLLPFTSIPEVGIDALAAVSPLIANATTSSETFALAVAEFNRIYSKLMNAIYNPSEKPSTPEALQNLANKAIQLAYFIGSTLLTELNTLPEEARITALKNTSSHEYYAFFYLPVMYHTLRDGILDLLAPERKDRISTFYTEDSVNNNWRALYNDYCDRIRMLISEATLNEGNALFISWTRKDVSPQKDFHLHPDSQSTNLFSSSNPLGIGDIDYFI